MEVLEGIKYYSSAEEVLGPKNNRYCSEGFKNVDFAFFDLKIDFRILKSKVKEIYQNIPIDKKDIREYTTKEKIWFYISKISFDFVCRIRNKFGYGVE